MLKKIHTTREAIGLLGGSLPVASMFEVTPKAVSYWRTTNRFPLHIFPRLTSELRERGYETVDELWPFGRSKAIAETSAAPSSETAA